MQLWLLDLSCVLMQEVLWSPEFCCFLDVTGSSSRIQEALRDFYLSANRKVNHSRTIYKNNNWLHLGQWQDWNTFLSSFDFFTFILIFFPEIMLYLPLFLSFKYWKPKTHKGKITATDKRIWNNVNFITAWLHENKGSFFSSTENYLGYLNRSWVSFSFGFFILFLFMSLLFLPFLQQQVWDFYLLYYKNIF